MAVVLREIKLVTRKEWVAMDPKKVYPMTHPIIRVKFTIENNLEPCYTKEECMKAVKEIQNNYSDPGMDDIPYNFLVGVDGYVYEGRGWNHRPLPNVLKDMQLWDQTIDIGILGGHALSTKEAYAAIRDAYKAAHEFVHYGVQQNMISKDYKFYGFSDDVLDVDFETLASKC